MLTSCIRSAKQAGQTNHIRALQQHAQATLLSAGAENAFLLQKARQSHRRYLDFHPPLQPIITSLALPEIPSVYKQGIIFSDFWETYQAVIPDDQHQAVGKDSGLTAHVERFNTIRLRAGSISEQRLARFVKKTLSFSKSEYMHLICLYLFFVRYNLERAVISRWWATTKISSVLTRQQ